MPSSRAPSQSVCSTTFCLFEFIFSVFFLIHFLQRTNRGKNKKLAAQSISTWAASIQTQSKIFVRNCISTSKFIAILKLQLAGFENRLWIALAFGQNAFVCLNGIQQFIVTLSQRSVLLPQPTQLNSLFVYQFAICDSFESFFSIELGSVVISSVGEQDMRVCLFCTDEDEIEGISTK